MSLFERRRNRELDLMRFRAEVNALDVTAQVKEWELFKRIGQQELLASLQLVPNWEAQYNCTEEELTRSWKNFIDRAILVTEELSSELQVSSPGHIVYKLESDNSFSKKCGVYREDDGTIVLVFFPAILELFLEYMFLKKQFLRTSVWYFFESLLAHEFYHIHQIIHFPISSGRRMQSEEYYESLVEYSARLFSLKWLQKQKPKTINEQLALFIAKKRIQYDYIAPMSVAKERTRKLFGKSKNGFLTQIKRTFKK